MNPGAEVFCFVLPVFQDSFILCAFLFPYLKATKHLGIFISLADFGELFSYQGILVDISVQFQDTGFQLVQISTLFFFVLFCSFSRVVEKLLPWGIWSILSVLLHALYINQPGNHS